MSLTIAPAQIVEESSSPLLAAHSSWERRPLGEVATILNGYAFPSKQFTPDRGTPLIRIRDISSESTTVRFVGDYDERYIIQPGELLVGMDGDFKCARWRGPEALLNQRVCKITPDPKQLDLDFLTHLLPGYLQAVHDLTSSTTVTHLSSRDVAQIPIPVPPLKEQRALARVFDAARSKQRSSSSHLRAARTGIERFRQAVLAAACSGHLTDEWREANPNLEPAAVLIERSIEHLEGSGDRPRRFEVMEPDFIKAPPSWEWAPLGWLAAVKGGIQKQPKRAPKQNAYPYLRVANVHRGRLDLSEIHDCELFDGELETYRLESGDLLVVEGNGSPSEIGRSALWRGEIENCVHQNHIIRVRCVEVEPPYVDLFWNSPFGSREIQDLAVTSSGLYSLSTKKIASFTVPIPPIDEQREIVRRVDQLLALADGLGERIEVAATCIDRSSQAVLAKAFRGELVTHALGER
jgi:type I restriction enzyme S subunit